jgi:superfamily II helicase
MMGLLKLLQRMQEIDAVLGSLEDWTRNERITLEVYKTCSKCEKPKLIAKFTYDKTTKDKRSPWCNDCKREQNKQRCEKRKKGAA